MLARRQRSAFCYKPTKRVKGVSLVERSEEALCIGYIGRIDRAARVRLDNFSAK